MSRELKAQDGQLAKVTAVVLAGGLGTRLRPLIPNKQKVVAEVVGRPFLSYNLDRLASCVQEAVLCVGHLSEQIQETFGAQYRSLKLNYSEEQMLLGTGGAIKFALPLVHSETILVLNGDPYCDADLDQFYNWHSSRGAKASIFLAKVENTKRYGRVNVGAQGEIISFDEKGAVEGPGLINAGIYFFERSLFDSMPKGKIISLENDIFPTLIGQGFFGYCGQYSTFIDIGTPESFKEADRIFREGCEVGQ